MTAFGDILFWLGVAAWLAGNLKFLAIVFRSSQIWFFGCLFVPFIPLIYFLLHPGQTWKPALTGTVGMLAAGVGYGLGGFTFLNQGI